MRRISITNLTIASLIRSCVLTAMILEIITELIAPAAGSFKWYTTMHLTVVGLQREEILITMKTSTSLIFPHISARVVARAACGDLLAGIFWPNVNFGRLFPASYKIWPLRVLSYFCQYGETQTTL